MTNEQHVAAYGRSLEVHRVVPGSLYSADPGACVTLCRSCHGPKPRSEPGTYPRGRITAMRMPDDLEAALEAFRAAQTFKPDRTAVGLRALEDFLRKEGFFPAPVRKP